MKSHHRTGKSKNAKISRREFIGSAAAATATFTMVPRHVLGGSGYTPPSEKLNVAIIGTGGQGTQNINELLGHPDVQITAICDVNEQSDYSRFYYGGVAGRKPARQLIEQHYADQKSSGSTKAAPAISISTECSKKKKASMRSS